MFFYESGISTSYDVFLPPGQQTVPNISGSYGCDMSKTYYTGYAPFCFAGKTAAQWILFHELVIPEDEEINTHRTGTLNEFDTSNDYIDITVPYRSDWPINKPASVSGMKYQFAQLAGTAGNPSFMYVRISGAITDVAKFLNAMSTNNLAITRGGVNYFIQFDEDNSEIRIYADSVLYDTISCTF